MAQSTKRKSLDNIVHPVVVTQTHSMCCIIECELKIQDTIEFFLASDLHLDHPKCHRALLRQHFEETIARGGYILLNGDILCIMQGKFDKRGNKASVRAEHSKGNYFDLVEDEAVEFLLPYARHILFMGYGNHETGVMERTEHDLLRGICDKIYNKTGHRIVLGQYHGFIWIRAGVTTKKFDQNGRISYLIYYNHGTGGESPVTKGQIEFERKQTHVEGHDAMWMGNNHQKTNHQSAVMYLDRINTSRKPKIRIIESIRTGTYKQEYVGKGWHVETGKAPKPLGGAWLRLKAVYGSSIYGTSEKVRKFAPEIIKSWHDDIEIDDGFIEHN